MIDCVFAAILDTVYIYPLLFIIILDLILYLINLMA